MYFNDKKLTKKKMRWKWDLWIYDKWLMTVRSMIWSCQERWIMFLKNKWIVQMFNMIEDEIVVQKMYDDWMVGGTLFWSTTITPSPLYLNAFMDDLWKWINFLLTFYV